MIWLFTIALSTFLCFALAPLAHKFGWVDSPDHRKQHSGDIPLVGGPAMVVACMCAMVWIGGWNESMLVLAWSSLIVFMTGLFDDRRHLPVSLRFGIQMAALLCMVFVGSVMLHNFGNLFWERMLGLGPLVVPITVFSALGVINAFNMIDGLDGLSGSLAVIALGGMAFFAGRAGFYSEHTVLLVIICAIAGFLLMNFRFAWRQRALVFMGDSGSSWLGFVLAWFFISLSQDDPAAGVSRAYAPIIAIWLFGLPLMDTTYVMLRRARLRQPIFGADRRHLHHLFMRSGFSVRQTWAAMIAAALVMAFIGVAAELLAWPEWLMFYAYIGLALGYFLAMERAWKKRRFLGRVVE